MDILVEDSRENRLEAMDDEELLLTVNARFYEAFENGDLHSLDEVWSHGETVRCVHPGWGTIIGWQSIRKSWESIIANGQSIRFSLRNVVPKVYNDLGVIVLEEEIVFGGDQVPQIVRAVATNLFERYGSGWKMIHHHASPVMLNAGNELSYRFN